MIDTVLTSNIEYYTRIIQENSTKRDLINAGSNIIELTYATPEAQASLENAEKMIFEISQKKNSHDMVRLTNLLVEVVDQIEYRFNNRGGCTGVPSDYFDLDSITAGFQKSDLVILAARPSMGKTAFALNIAQNVSIGKKGLLQYFLLKCRNHS
jgi:replicative DNA helicase